MQEPLIQDSRSHDLFGHADLAYRPQVGVDPLSASRAKPPSNEWVTRTCAPVEANVEQAPDAVTAYDCDDLVDQLTIFKKILCRRDIALRAIRNAHRTSLRALFCVSPPPQLDTLVGEYDAQLLDQGNLISNAVLKSVFRTQGSWLGKAFYPVGRSTGIGYNMFRSRGSVVRKLPMDTRIAESALDPGLSLKINYQAKNLGIIQGLTGEVRQVTTNVLIGIGVVGPTLGARDLWRRKIPFLLVGPHGSFRHKSIN